MRAEEAIKSLRYLEHLAEIDSTRYRCRENVAVDMAIEALEKQIPKKPKNYHGEEHPKWVCPRCDEDAYYALNAGEEQYCSECGQCIDWEGVE